MQMVHIQGNVFHIEVLHNEDNDEDTNVLQDEVEQGLDDIDVADNTLDHNESVPMEEL